MHECVCASVIAVTTLCACGASHSCPVGTFNSDLGAANVSQCTLCPAGRYSSQTGRTDSGWCFPCAKYEDSLPGADVCWPGVIAVIASDTPPIVPGLSTGTALLR